MLSPGEKALAVGGAISALAAVAHLACIVVGAPAYRVMGAGERMALAAAAGKIQPTLVTLTVASVLALWSVYAFGGAGIIGHLPLTKVALCSICAAYLGRAVAFPLLRPAFPGDSTTFWLVSSGICLVTGLLHLFGILASWPNL
jgi:hypothetical protein